MPIVTATPRGQANGQVLREFVDSVGTSSVTYTYPTAQEWLAIRNIGTQPVTITVGGNSQAVQPGQRWEKNTIFSSFDIASTSGVQAFEVVADESGSAFGSPEGRYLASAGVSSSTKSMAVQMKGSKIRCAWKYNASQDMWLDFDKLGVNGITQIYDIWKLSNPSPQVSLDLTQTATVFNLIRSDTVGPFVVKANGGLVNGAAGLIFSGGVHAHDGTNAVPVAASALPSAASVSVTVYADGLQVLDGQTLACDRIDIEVVNDIQGYNTTDVGVRALTPSPGFVPRYILRETVHYTVTPGSVEVTNDIRALEDITIERYYGIQMYASQPLWTKVHYVNGQQSAYVNVNTGTSSDSGVKSTYSNVDRIVYSDTARNNFFASWMDNTYGIGTRANVAATEKLAFSTNIPKSYFSLVFNLSLVVTANQVVSWRGGYIWSPGIPCAGSDLAYTYREGNQRKYVVDFLAASTGSMLVTNQNDRNKAATVDSKSAAVTVNSRVGSLGLNLSTTGYGQAKITV